MSNQPDDVLRKIDSYYTGRLSEHGPTPRGVDWNSTQAQETRFDQLLKLIPQDSRPSILDYGCGYGAFVPYALRSIPGARIAGYDVSASMIAEALKLQSETASTFTSNRADLTRYDYVTASGIFSVKMDVPTESWESYVHRTLDDMAALAEKGFAFNMLTSFSDPERMRPDLYYADPHRIFDLCRTRYSRNVALLHDYEIYEFTVHVRL